MSYFWLRRNGQIKELKHLLNIPCGVCRSLPTLNHRVRFEIIVRYYLSYKNTLNVALAVNNQYLIDIFSTTGLKTLIQRQLWLFLINAEKWAYEKYCIILPLNVWECTLVMMWHFVKNICDICWKKLNFLERYKTNSCSLFPIVKWQMREGHRYNLT